MIICECCRFEEFLEDEISFSRAVSTPLLSGVSVSKSPRHYQREEFESSKVENNVDVFDSQDEKFITRSRTHQQKETLNDFSREKEIENEAHNTETSRRMKNEEIEEIFENDAE